MIAILAQFCLKIYKKTVVLHKRNSGAECNFGNPTSELGMLFAYKYIAGVVRYCNCYGIELPQGMESSLLLFVVMILLALQRPLVIAR